MDKVELLNCLCNPLETGIWSLDLFVPTKADSIGKVIGLVEPYFPSLSFILVLVRMIERVNSSLDEKEKKKTSDAVKNFGVTLEKSEKMGDSKGLFSLLMSDFLSEGNEEIIDLVKKYSSNFSYFRDFFLISNKMFGDDLVFSSFEKKEFFKISYSSPSRNHINFTSYHKSSLDELAKALSPLFPGMKMESRKLFSPERLVFSDYAFLFLRNEIYGITENEKINRNIGLALREYFSGKGDGAIRFIGLAMEEIFAEIYEICVRERCPDSSGLRELYNKIVKEIKNIFYPDNKNLAYQKLVSMLNNYNVEGKEDYFKIMSKQFMLHLCARMRRVEGSLNSIETKMVHEKESLLFNEKVISSIEDTIQYRNKISHRYVGEIGNFETVLSLRGLMHLLIWWEYIKKGVKNWEKDKREVLELYLIPESKAFMRVDKLRERFDYL